MPELLCRLMRVRSAPDVAVVRLQGAIDPKNVSTLQVALAAARGKGYRILVLDLGEIRYINSAGLASLVTFSDALLENGGALLMANPQPKVKLIFELMGLTAFFKLHKSVAAAIAAAVSARKFRRVTSAGIPQRARRQA